MKWFVLLCRIALGIIFIVASVPKIIDPHSFSLMVFRYQILPYSLVNLAAIMMPWVEFTAGLALIVLPSFRKPAAFILFGLLVIFTVSIIFNLWRGINIACGCFTVDPDAERATAWKLVENAGFLALALVAWLGNWRKSDVCQRSAIGHVSRLKEPY